MKTAFFDTKEYDRRAFSVYSGKNELNITFFETKLSRDTVSLCEGFDAVCVFVNDDISSYVIERLYSFGVRLIALRCSGYNNVDLSSAKDKIAVVRVPAYSPHAVAEHAAALLLCSVRRIHKAYNRTREFNFSLDGLCGFDLHGKTVGVIGTGRIGRAFIEICHGFGMNVLAFDKFQSDLDGVFYTDLDMLFRHSDIISLHCPLNDETFHTIDRRSIALMKKGVIIINTSRGALIDSDDLLAGIKERRIGAACLDVYEEESDLFFSDRSGHIMNDDTLARLLSMPNVIVTSHQAFLTNEALANIALTTVNNILDYFVNGYCENEISFTSKDKAKAIIV